MQLLHAMMRVMRDDKYDKKMGLTSASDDSSVLGPIQGRDGYDGLCKSWPVIIHSAY
jgi:hypothetical protein